MREIPNYQSAMRQVIRAHRERAGITQAKLAERMDCAVSYIKALEGGARMPLTSSFILLANALDVDPAELMRDLMNKLAFLNETEEL